MAAIVTGLVPILKTAVEASTDYKGRTLWFGFLSVRLVTLYVAEMPWGKLDTDFQCNTTAEETEFCRRSCFNQHFDVPVVMLWNFTYVLFSISVLLMELLASQLRHSLMKRSMKRDPGGQSGGEDSLVGVKGHSLAKKDVMIDFHKQKTTLVVYLLCVGMRIGIEGSFLSILLLWHLPKVDGLPIHCSTALCPGPFQCFVRFDSEKRMSIYSLATISTTIVFTSIVFFLYSMCHYLVIDRSKLESVV
ncbi:CXB1 protein, partial [Polyodon spathula]|nr:gap junction beta-1 protein [Polyodon spathula]MBN3271379.1 CXB1 protein [Polyodon spathula]